MPASTNKRIYYAVHQVGLKPDGDAGAYSVLHGIQSVGMTTNFNLDQVFELGQVAIYENYEDIPDIEVTLNKQLDGYPLIYHKSTQNALTPTLSGRSSDKAIFAMSIFLDTQDSAESEPDSAVACSGMFVSSLGYNFPLEEPFNEDVTLVGNDKLWANDTNIQNAADLARSNAIVFAGGFAGNNDAPIGVGGVNRKEHMIFDYNADHGLDSNTMVADSNTTILPPEVFGVSASGTNEKSNGVDYDAHVSSISVSADLGREALNELGRKAPYHRTVTFPIEVTTEIEVTSTSGDMISATENGILGTGVGICDSVGSNLNNRTIRIATCDGTRVYCGVNNKLASSSYSGGDAGGGNVAVTYTFTTFNDLTVMHSGDPNTNYTWAGRDTYLRDL